MGMGRTEIGKKSEAAFRTYRKEPILVGGRGAKP